jgi:hypothetical protein
VIRAAWLGAALLAATPAAAESPLALEGQGLRALAAHPLVALPLRSAAQGRSGTVFERLNLPGPPVAVAEGRWVFARGCAPAGCARDGIFLALDSVSERLYLLVVEAGRPVLVVPPFGTSWPAALREGVAPFLPSP